MTKDVNGATLLCSALRDLGVDCIFGLPGTQNLPIFEALRRSGLRTIIPTHETAAAFMANGYYRSSGRPGVLLTIPGPGFTYALSGLAEARLDSAAVLQIAGSPASAPGNAHQLQRIDQTRIANPIVKRVYDVTEAAEMVQAVAAAYRTTLSEEPGPVILQVTAEALSRKAPASRAVSVEHRVSPDGSTIEAIARIMTESARPLLYVGQGASDAPAELCRLAESIGSPLITTTSARGVLPEDHPLCLSFDAARGGARKVNALIDRADLVLALGCKFSHNGALGFRLRIPPEKLIHVDASTDSLGANYPARMLVRADVPIFLRLLLSRSELGGTKGSGWTSEEIEAAHRESDRAGAQLAAEPAFPGIDPPNARGFFQLLNRVVPRDCCLVTDSGMHQMLARRYFRVYAPRGFIAPTDFQSMGFGIPSAIGAALAVPDRPVAALVGDGGLAISAMELATALREGLDLTVLVFCDGHFGLIRMNQIADYGLTHGTRLPKRDLAALARSMGIQYAGVAGSPEKAMRAAFEKRGVRLLEIRIEDSLDARRLRAVRLAARLGGALLRRRVGTIRRGRNEDVHRDM